VSVGGIGRLEDGVAAGAAAKYGGARAIGAAAIGNALEWYDFSVYALFAIYISKTVFVGGDSVTQLVRAFLVFGIGFIARPIGAVVLGAYADHAGRRAALTLSLIVMALGTLCIAVVPPYVAIGVAAPVVVLIGRLLQGLSAGGEIGGAVSFLVEHAPPGKRGRYASWLQASMALSNVLGAGVATILAYLLSVDSLTRWGWRVPFVLGLLIAPVGLWLRARLDETPAFEAARREKRTAGPLLKPILDILKEAPWALGAAAGASIVWVVGVYTFVFFLPTYAQRTLHYTPSQAFTASVIGNIVMAIACVGSGRLADRIGPLQTVRWGALLLLVCPLPVFAWIGDVQSEAALIAGQTFLCLILALLAGSAPALLASLFPTHIRSSGVSLGYNFAATIFGGFTGAILTKLTEGAGYRLAPAAYVVAAAAVSLAVLFMVRPQTAAQSV
jgi:MFS transporter, MHS family, proline/betaine transporter